MPNTRETEKLTNIVCEAMEDGCIGRCNHPPCFKVEQVVNALIANGVTVQEWIPVTERKPTKEDADKYGRVLAMEMGMITLVNYRGPINYPDRFPHWMPLPEPPKGE